MLSAICSAGLLNPSSWVTKWLHSVGNCLVNNFLHAGSSFWWYHPVLILQILGTLFVLLASILQRFWWWNYLHSGFSSCHDYVLLLLWPHFTLCYILLISSSLVFAKVVVKETLFFDDVSLLKFFVALCFKLLVIWFSRSFTISVGSSRLSSLLAVKIFSDTVFWLKKTGAQVLFTYILKEKVSWQIVKNFVFGWAFRDKIADDLLILFAAHAGCQ